MNERFDYSSNEMNDGKIKVNEVSLYLILNDSDVLIRRIARVIKTFLIA